MEWFVLIVPISACIIAFLFFRHRFSIWEYLLPPAATVLVVLICKFSVKYSLVSDNEYWGSMVTTARYYEYWDTWVTMTCSYTTCTTDSEGNEECTTHYYDCSYCDTNPQRWKAYDDAGNDWDISEEYYNYLKSKWNKPVFIELNRSISESGSCGTDGDAEEITWNNKIYTSEAAITTHRYTNKVQASKSAFRMPNISNKKAAALGLYKYPDKYNFYKQKVVLGLDSIYSQYGPQTIKNIETNFQYFNGKYGARNKVKLFVLLFYNKPISISFEQEAYWDGGNQNELVVCIGLDRATQGIEWVRPFSWTDRERVLVDCREDIAALGKFDPDGVYAAIENAVSQNVMYKDFKKDFNYLTVDLPGWTIWLIWILSIVVTAGVFYWCLINEYEENINLHPNVQSHTSAL